MRNAMQSSRDESVRRTPTQTRQGVTPRIVRYVLGISLTLCVVAFIFVYFVGLHL